MFQCVQPYVGQPFMNPNQMRIFTPPSSGRGIHLAEVSLGTWGVQLYPTLLMLLNTHTSVALLNWVLEENMFASKNQYKFIFFPSVDFCM